MRSRRTPQDDLAAIARRRLELLTAELSGLRETPDAGEEAAGAVPEFGSGARPESRPESRPEFRPEFRSESGAGSPPASLPTEGAGAVRGQAAQFAPPAGFAEQFTWDVPPIRGRHARRPVAAPGLVGGWVHDRLPPTLQGRVRLTAAHLSVVALLVAGAFAVTAWWVVRADGPETVVPAATWSDSGPTTGGPSPAALVTPVADPATGGGEGDVVVVDVEGKVRRPGIVTLPTGSRVVDALEKAGGARRGVDLTTLNLARVLVDGEQILVGVEPSGGVAAPAASQADGSPGGAGPLVNINSATQAELEELPGVGPVTASAILQWRTDNGPFRAVDDLLEVSGIGDATLAKIAPFVTL